MIEIRVLKGIQAWDQYLASGFAACSIQRQRSIDWAIQKLLSWAWGGRNTGEV